MTDKERKLFVLDTNILMHDPTAIYHFQEHDVYLPMVVLEELDRHKSGLSEVARNVRQTNRMLVELMSGTTHAEVVSGIKIPSFITHKQVSSSGRLFFQTDDLDQVHPTSLPGHNVDNAILGIALGLQKKDPRQVIIVSKDINLRIKAGILGIPAEDYYTDQALNDVTLLHSGLHSLENNLGQPWQRHGVLERWRQNLLPNPWPSR